ncbi:hypothetical protein CNR22_18510 [Sphingobacteriaceae bacterium]|nr:hypothetical protein CNR22_18510 [Sphingobacteriaceae bacterium]
MNFTTEKYYLKSSSFFDHLSKKESAFIKNKMVRKEYKPGQILFKEGTYSRGIYIVKKGKIKIFQTNGEGKESIVYLYRKNDFFGYRPLLGDDPHPTSAAAVDTVVVSYIPAEVFLETLENSTALAKRLLVNLSKEFSVWINKLSTFSTSSVKERIAISLLIFNEIYHIDHSKNKYTVISINRNDFAAFVGTAKENLVRILRVFKDEKIIASKRTNLTVLNQKALMELLNGI